ncbi:hypothetical protein ACWDSD_42205 [Streptomyces spiralis]
MFTVLAAISGLEREHVPDRTLEGHESVRKRGKTIGGTGVTSEDIVSISSRYDELCPSSMLPIRMQDK